MAQTKINDAILKHHDAGKPVTELSLDGVNIATVIPRHDKSNTYGKIFAPGLFPSGEGQDTNEDDYGDRPQSPGEANAGGPGGFWFEIHDFEVVQTSAGLCWNATLELRDALGVSPSDRKEYGLGVVVYSALGAKQHEIVTHAQFPITGVCRERGQRTHP
jgi:hypothetical protein